MLLIAYVLLLYNSLWFKTLIKKVSSLFQFRQNLLLNLLIYWKYDCTVSYRGFLIRKIEFIGWNTIIHQHSKLTFRRSG